MRGPISPIVPLRTPMSRQTRRNRLPRSHAYGRLKSPLNLGFGLAGNRYSDVPKLGSFFSASTASSDNNAALGSPFFVIGTMRNGRSPSRLWTSAHFRGKRDPFRRAVVVAKTEKQ